MKFASTFIYGLLYGLLLSSYTSSESRLYPSGVKGWQYYFESLPDDGETYQNWLPYFIGYALFVDLMHKDIKGGTTISSEDKRDTSKKKQSKKYAKSHASQTLPPPTPAYIYQPPTAIEIEPDFLHDDEDGDKHWIVCQEPGHTNRKRRRETHTDGYEAKRHKLALSPTSDSDKRKKVKRRKRTSIFPEISSQHLLGDKLRGRHRQYRNQVSHSTLKSHALHCFLAHRSALNQLRIHPSAAQYEEAKRHLKRCQRICHRLKSTGDVSVCYLYQGKLALEMHFYSKAARLFQKAISKHGPVRALKGYQPSLSALYIQCSYAFSGAKQYEKAIKSSLLGIKIAHTHEDSTAADHSYHDIICRAMGNNESTIELVSSDQVDASQDEDIGQPSEHKYDKIGDEQFEQAVEEQGPHTLEVGCVYNVPLIPEAHMETTSLCPILKSFITSPNVDEQQLVDDSNVKQLKRPDYLVSRNMPTGSGIRPFVAQYGDSEQFRGTSVRIAQGLTFIVAIHQVHVQPRCCHSPSELLRYSRFIATQHNGMQNHSNTSATSTIHLICIADTLYVWLTLPVIFPHKDNFPIIHFRGCAFNQLLDHLHSGASLRPCILGVLPQVMTVPKPVLSLPLPATPVTFTVSSNSVMCIVGNSAASIVEVGEENSIHLGALPSAKTEAQAVAYILRTRPLLDEHATKSVVLDLMERSTVIHVAAHGILYQGYFGLILDPGKDSCDSVITSHDIEQLNLSAALVVLSCCDSGHSTNGIQGMARIFIEAGAQCVLTTQSEVPDESASVFMQFFYCYLSHGLSSVVALDRAKSSMRALPEYSQNIHWDRYNLHGKEIIMQWEADQTLSEFGSRSAFPCLQVVLDMEKALVNQSSFPTAVQILCPESLPEVTRQVASDFICTYHHCFKGGVHWICCGQNLKDISKVSQSLVVADGVFEGANFTDLLRNVKFHVLLLVSQSSLKTAKRIIQCISLRDVQVHTVKPLSRMQIQQQTIADSHLSERSRKL